MSDARSHVNAARGVGIDPVQLNQVFIDEGHHRAHDANHPPKSPVIQRISDRDTQTSIVLASMRLDGKTTAFSALCDCIGKYAAFLTESGDPAGQKLAADLASFRSGQSSDPKIQQSLQNTYTEMLTKGWVSFRTKHDQELKPSLTDCPPTQSTLVVGNTDPTLKTICQMWVNLSPDTATAGTVATSSGTDQKATFGNCHAALLGRKPTPGAGLPWE